ncbi:MAG: protein translocase subunit SecDF [Lewinellaceae bacterium]|nr:protein translocase subunit SecDF [Saprospiraceae bacterium]MCB9339131.1 protein translocase subunit SecDF [Lewinellaceae bacterium]
MQGKGIIKFFLVALAVVSLIQFIYVLPTNRVENKADKYAHSLSDNLPAEQQRTAFKNARAAYLDSMSSEVIFKIPLVKSFTYQDLKGSQLNFGLDLKGGMSVLMQVDLRDFIRALAGSSSDKSLEDALAAAAKKQQTSQSDFITLFADSWKEVAPDKPMNSIFKRNESLSSQINASTSDGEVTSILRKKADETVDLTFKLLKERIDKLGVVGPNVSLDAGRDMILVELPGVDNPKRARTYLQAAAKLEFWNVYRITDAGIQSAFVAANEKLRKMEAGEPTETTKQEATTQDTSKIVVSDSLKTDTNGVADIPQIADDTTSPLSDPNSLNQGPLFDIFTFNNTGAYGLAAMGTADKNKRNNVMEMLNRPGVKELFPRDVMFLWSRKPIKNPEGVQTSDLYELYAIKKEPGKEAAPLEGDRVIDASVSPDPTTGELAISLSMDQEGARTWGNMTEKAFNDNKRQIAIVLDSTVVSAPTVQAAIRDGRSQITGGFTVQEAQDLANILQIGKLPARTQILQESLVGPSLGAENISTSLNALLVGFLLVLAFMIFYYGGAGLVSIAVLFLNVIFMLGAIASFGTVLTLPGIAGIVLTIGMAVDANVIIYERVREELRAGKSLVAAVKDGYKHSYSAIIDGNVTTFLTAVVLAVFGLGPIKGFAVVLMIGIMTTLFTAVLVSRLIIDWWMSRGNDITFWRPATRNVLANLNVDWMGKRKKFYILSGVITLLGLVSFFTRGFDLGVDFKGGYSVNIEFAQDPGSDAIRNALAGILEKEPVVKAVDTDKTYNIVTDYLVNDEGEDAPERVMDKLHEGLASLSGGATLNNFKDPDAAGLTHVTSFSKVGPTVADDLRDSAWEAVIFGLLVIFLYILIRFSKWQYSLGAVIATSHDALIVVSVFSLLHGILPFPMEVDQAFIAAILTIIGYSVNDTVIVYDRIREYFGLYPEKEKNEVINMAINSTMSRTLITGLTTLFTVFVLWMFGSGSIKGFAFALVVGVVVGTYSSVFIASPVMSDLSKADIRITRKEKDEKGKKTIKRHTAKA